MKDGSLPALTKPAAKDAVSRMNTHMQQMGYQSPKVPTMPKAPKVSKMYGSRSK